MPDISLIVELSELYEVSIPEMIHGERNMKDTEKEIINEVIDYSTTDKEDILKKIKLYSAISIICLVAGVIVSVFDYSNQYDFLKSTLFSFSLIYLVSICLLCTGKMEEMQKRRSKILLLLLALCLLFFMLMMVLICL